MIWLDLPLPLLVSRLLRRSWRRWRSKELLWGTNYERFWPQLMVWRKEESLLWWIVTQHGRKRHSMLRYMVDPRWSHIRFFRLTLPSEVEAFSRAIEQEVMRGSLVDRDASRGIALAIRLTGIDAPESKPAYGTAAASSGSNPHLACRIGCLGFSCDRHWLVVLIGAWTPCGHRGSRRSLYQDGLNLVAGIERRCLRGDPSTLQIIQFVLQPTRYSLQTTFCSSVSANE